MGKDNINGKEKHVIATSTQSGTTQYTTTFDRLRVCVDIIPLRPKFDIPTSEVQTALLTMTEETLEDLDLNSLTFVASAKIVAYLAAIYQWFLVKPDDISIVFVKVFIGLIFHFTIFIWHVWGCCRMQNVVFSVYLLHCFRAVLSCIVIVYAFRCSYKIDKSKLHLVLRFKVSIFFCGIVGVFIFDNAQVSH